MAGYTTAFIVVSLLQFLPASAVFRVNSENGKNSPSCLEAEPEEACRTLGYVTTGLGSHSNWEILVETNIHLNEVILLENIVNITITGSSSSANLDMNLIVRTGCVTQ